MDVNVPDARLMPATLAPPAAFSGRGRRFAWTLLLLAVAFGAVPAAIVGTGSSYLAQIAITTMIFVILSASLNHVTGTAGLLSIGHAAFYGIGAYAAALLSTRLGLPFVVTLPAAGLIAALFGFLVALLRRRHARHRRDDLRGPAELGGRDPRPDGHPRHPADLAVRLAGRHAAQPLSGGRGHRRRLRLGAAPADPLLLRQRAAGSARGRPVRRQHGHQRGAAEDRVLRRRHLLRRHRRGAAGPHLRLHRAGQLPLHGIDPDPGDGGGAAGWAAFPARSSAPCS